jgi:hypothetical protein
VAGIPHAATRVVGCGSAPRTPGASGDVVELSSKPGVDAGLNAVGPDGDTLAAILCGRDLTNP